MAVYTPVTEDEARCFLTETYPELGRLRRIVPITEGIENSNFLIETDSAKAVLTLIENRTDPKSLPWITGLMAHLAEHHFPCPAIFNTAGGERISTLKNRPAILSEFLAGKNNPSPITEEICASLGQKTAQMHLLGQRYSPTRRNPLGVTEWGDLLARSKDQTGQTPSPVSLKQIIATAEKTYHRLALDWPKENHLPRGAVHADLFPDNVFYDTQNKLSGVIDFYFAATDFLLWDIAIILNAWCFTDGDDPLFQPRLAHSFLKSYEAVRPLTSAEKSVFPLFCQGGAMRFLTTRLYDWINRPSGALVIPKSPFAYAKRLDYFQTSSFEISF